MSFQENITSSYLTKVNSYNKSMISTLNSPTKLNLSCTQKEKVELVNTTGRNYPSLYRTITNTKYSYPTQMYYIHGTSKSDPPKKQKLSHIKDPKVDYSLNHTFL